MEIKVLFCGTERDAYRDPACIYENGEYHLFFTHSVLEDDGYMYNTVSYSHGPSLEALSDPIDITEKNHNINFCSPGCVLKVGEEYIIPCCSYPLPEPYQVSATATQDARLYLLKTKDFKTFSSPKPLNPKEDTAIENAGRMIDPYLFRDRDDTSLYHLFFKQNGVSHSVSRDLSHWTYLGRQDGGENASIYQKDGAYHLYHSPKNGIGHKVSSDLVTWEDLGVSTLSQNRLPWADGRITAGFFMEAGPGEKTPYLLFFHGSKKSNPPETHGAATLVVAFLTDTNL